LASIYAGGNSIAFSQPEESMRPVHHMVLLRKLPNSVTPAMNGIYPIENHA